MAVTGTLHLLCGKIGAGKSTLAATLAAREATILVAEDTWLGALFDDRIATGADYVRFSARLRKVMTPHIAGLLRAGLSVVLDFPANTRRQRAGLRTIVAATGAPHKLHYLDVPDDVCLARLHARNARGEHPFKVTEEQFRAFTAHFAPPTEDEGFVIVRHGESD